MYNEAKHSELSTILCSNLISTTKYWLDFCLTVHRGEKNAHNVRFLS